jgi:catechol 2,3-dioxygenase-like lactoylglutathione lyase family enzyme
MHRSVLRELTIDCQTDDLEAAAAFWSAALGREAVRARGAQAAKYFQLRTKPDEIDINIQRVSHASRVHLDLETDDVEAEVGRLEALGARRLHQVHHWWVMEAPTGHRFCVVGEAGERLARDGNVWGEPAQSEG